MKINIKRNGEKIDETNLTPFEKKMIKQLKIATIIWVLIVFSAMIAIVTCIGFVAVELIKHFA
jgi:hypothetical protein